MLSLKKTVLTALTFIGLTAQANASVMNYYLGNYLPGSTLTTFDSLAVGSTNKSFNLANIGTLTLNHDAQIVQGTTGIHADPYYDKGAVNGLKTLPTANGPDTSPYVSVYTGGTATFTLSKPDHYFGLEWGSIDTYNEITFYSGNKVIGQWGGQTFITLGNLNPGNQGTTGTDYINFTSAYADPITKVVMSSNAIAFEFDNVRVSQAPLPAALPMFAAAVMLAGAAGLRSRRGCIARA